MDAATIRKFQQAVQLQGQGQLDAAASHCQAVLQQYPDAPEPLHFMGLLCKQQGHYEEAERLLRASVERAPGRADFLGNLGNLYSQLNRYSDAESAYRRALAVDATFRPARLGLARVLNEAGVFEAAGKEASLLLDSNANDAEAQAALGAALAGQERYPEAERAYRVALRIAPAYGAARHNLAAMLAKTERIEDSLEELERAANDGVSGVEIDFNRASALMKLYRFEEGETLLAASVDREPGYAPAQRLLAQFRYMRGETDFAAPLAAATQRFPANVELQVAYAQVLHGANELDAAESALKTAIMYCQGQPRLLALLASVYQEAGSYDDALRCARQSTQADVHDPLLNDYVIDALMSLGRADEAMPLIRAGRERLPDHQWYIAIEATAARLLGDPLYAELCDYEQMVRSYDLEPPPGWQSMAEFHADLLPVLHDRHRFYAHPLDQSLRRGTQTPRNLIGDPDPLIQAFMQAVQAPIAEFRAAIGNAGGHPLSRRNSGDARLSGCWSVRLQRDGFHVNHIHPEGWISSAYYAEVPAEVADTDAQSGWIKFGEPRFPVPGATAEKTVQPVAGRLVLFPSYLWHGTTPIRGDEPRMTLAFDVVAG